MTRPIYQIAREITLDWQKPFYGALPYLVAMRSLQDLKQQYCEDSAESIILYFLSNASTWRGETARRIKAELKTMLKEHQNGQS